MLNRRALSNLGSHVYGLAAIALGVIGLVWGDLPTVWWPIQTLGAVPIARHLRTLLLSCCFWEARPFNGVGLGLVYWCWPSSI